MHKIIKLTCLAMLFVNVARAIPSCVTIEPGENLWRLVASVGTCLNSFTPIVLNELSAIESTVDDINENLLSVSDVLGSQIMNIDTTLGNMIVSDIETILTSEIAMITSTLDDIHEDLYSEFDMLQSQIMHVDEDLVSVSDVLTSQIDSISADTSCLFGTAITQADLPITITLPGFYRLCGDVFSESDGSLITIAASNVVLDLNEYNISFSPLSVFSAIEISSGNHDIIIRNGTIDLESTTASGITIDTIQSSNVYIANIAIKGFNEGTTTGIIGLNSTDFVVENCQIDNVPLGIRMQGCSQYVIRGCVVTNPGLVGIEIIPGSIASSGCEISQCNVFVAATDAFNIAATPGSYTYVKECSAFSSQSGFVTTGNSIVLEDCVAMFNTQDGFLLTGNDMTLERCVSSSNFRIGFNSPSANTGLVIRDSIANSNSSFGFSITHADALLEGCVAVNNDNHGFVTQSGTLSLRECSSTGNLGIGFNLTTVAGTVIKDCFAAQNTSSGINANALAQVILDTRSFENGAADNIAGSGSTVCVYGSPCTIA